MARKEAPLSSKFFKGRKFQTWREKQNNINGFVEPSNAFDFLVQEETEGVPDQDSTLPFEENHRQPDQIENSQIEQEEQLNPLDIGAGITISEIPKIVDGDRLSRKEGELQVQMCQATFIQQVVGDEVITSSNSVAGEGVGPHKVDKAGSSEQSLKSFASLSLVNNNPQIDLPPPGDRSPPPIQAQSFPGLNQSLSCSPDIPNSSPWQESYTNPTLHVPFTPTLARPCQNPSIPQAHPVPITQSLTINSSDSDTGGDSSDNSKMEFPPGFSPSREEMVLIRELMEEGAS